MTSLRILSRFTLTFAAILCVAAISHADDWTDWRGPFQNGYSPDTGLPATWSPEGKNLVFKADYGSRSTPLVMKGRVFVFNYKIDNNDPSTIQERVICADADTGKIIWEHLFPVFHTDIVTVRLGWTVMCADPATGYVYVHGTQGFLICLDGMAAAPTVVWQRSMTEEWGRITGYGGRVTSPMLFEDLVVFGMVNSSYADHAKGANRFVAMDKKTGAVRWWSEPAGAVKDTYYSVPVWAKIKGVDLIISGCADGSVVAMQARTGKPVWSYTFGSSAINCSPVVEGEYVYIGHGEENNDNNIQGRVICLDAGQVTGNTPKLVWQKDGITNRYTSPTIHDGRLYITDEIGKLFCLDAKTGEQHWRFNYGRDSRGSPVLADGKIYIGEVNSKFYILEPGAKSCKKLSTTFFPAVAGGSANVEINGSAAVANGKVYFATSEELFCIAEPKRTPSKTVPPPPPVPAKAGPIAQLQIVPAELTLSPGEKATFTVKGYDADGNFAGEVKADDVAWEIAQPPIPPGGKVAPPPLAAEVKNGVLTIDAKKPSQQGAILVKQGKMMARSRIRVAPTIPYAPDFAKVPLGATPGGWVNTQGKFLIGTDPKGVQVLKKVNDKASPLIARGNAFIGTPEMKDYTVQADVQCTMIGSDLPDMGIVANRYTLILAGNIQKLRLVSWDALPRVDTTIPFKVQPGVWYTMKLTTDFAGKQKLIKGKVWERGQEEPKTWTVTIDDPRPILDGAPALYAYITGIPAQGPGNDVFFDKVKVTPNPK